MCGFEQMVISMANKLLNDLPVKTADEDLMGRTRFAENLADAIINYTGDKNGQGKISGDDCLVIGLEGPWGSGKTSLINLVKENLARKDASIYTAVFNSWTTLDTVGMSAAFFDRLLKCSRQEHFKFVVSKAAEKFLNNVTIGGSLKLPILQAAEIKVEKKFDFNDKESALEAKKDQINKDMNSEEQNWIVFFIDDIDRIPAEGIRVLFQLVKNIANFPKIIYVLAYDRSVVTKALTKIQESDGEAYLQKVVQIVYDVPEPEDEDIYGFMAEKLKNLIADDIVTLQPEERFNALYFGGLDFYLKNLRDCKRVYNAFALKYALCRGEVDAVDLFGITVLEVYENDIYNLIKTSKDRMLGQTENSERLPSEDLKVFADRFIEGKPKNQEESIREIIGILFPGFWKRTKKNDVPGYIRSQRNMTQGISLGDREGFDKYFRLAVSKNQVSNRSVMEFLQLSDGDSLSKQLQDWDHRNLLYSAFFKIHHQLLKERENGGNKDVNLEKLRHLLGVLTATDFSKDHRTRSFDSFFARNDSIAILVRFLCDNNMRQGIDNFYFFQKLMNDESIDIKYKGLLLKCAGDGQDLKVSQSANRSRDQVVSESEFIELRDDLLKLIDAYDRNKLSGNESSDFLMELWQYYKPEAFREFLQNAKSSLEFLRKLCIFLRYDYGVKKSEKCTYRLRRDLIVYFTEDMIKQVENYFNSVRRSWIDSHQEIGPEEETVGALYLLLYKKKYLSDKMPGIDSGKVIGFLEGKLSLNDIAAL